ncbi:MAG: hypothetical protein HY589_05450 [Candidatus Omnitrophica bacterium]|nr:hypothetical protein [Candidatus Omnitrophota bacterium]
MGEKDKKQLIVLGVGAVVLAGLIFFRVSSRPKGAVLLSEITGGHALPAGGAPGPGTAASTPVAQTAVSAGQAGGGREIKYTGRENRDPLDNSALFAGIAAPEPSAPPQKEPEIIKEFPKDNFSISAIIWGSKRPQAIINDKILGVGEKLDGAQIVGIDKKGVHLDFEGREVLLPIK